VAEPPRAAAAPPAVEPSPTPAEPLPVSTIVRSRLRRVILVGGTLLGLVAAWEVFTYFVAYTDDAYVRSDLVGVAPQVTGPIIKLYVVDNQTVKLGEPLYTIDPTPFQLEVNQYSAQIAEEEALLKVSAGGAGERQGFARDGAILPDLCR
jgi:multidrug efflux system membrane fusion protein